MRILLYIVLAIIAIVITFFAWFFIFYMKVPTLSLSEELSEDQRIEVIDNWFRALQKDNKFNGVVLIAKEGKPLLIKAYGFTNFKKDQSLTSNSSLRLASVSKQFTAAGIMVLKENQKISYDDPVFKYINNFPYKDVSIRNLLNQTSGIPDIYMELAEKNKGDIDLLTNEIAVDLIVKENRQRKNQTNENYHYSNTNYVILARIIEVISGTSFEEFMSTEIFEPLEMKNTRVWNLKSKEPTFENKADDFDNLKGNVTEIYPTFIDGIAGDGAVFSSANDMLIWDEFWYGNKLISETNLVEAFKKPKLNNGKSSNYGFGWIISEDGMWHNGAWLGANTAIFRNTKRKTCTVILDNSSNIFFGKILKELGKMNKTQ